MKDKIINYIKENKRQVLVLFFLVFLIILGSYTMFSKDYTKVYIRRNNKKIFSFSDLTVDSLKFSDNENRIIRKYGEPLKKERYIKYGYRYKIYSYKDLEIKLKEYYDDYIVMGVTVTSPKYETSRKIKVNDSIKSVMKKYRVENSTGKYLYGNFTEKSVLGNSITDNVYYGKRDKAYIEYTNRDKFDYSVNNQKNVNQSVIKYYYKDGRVSKISWAYDIRK